MDVADWLRALGLERYEAAFHENDVGTEDIVPSHRRRSRGNSGLPLSAIGVGCWRRSPSYGMTLRHSRRPCQSATTGPRHPQPNDGRSRCCSVISWARRRSLPGLIQKSCAKY